MGKSREIVGVERFDAERRAVAGDVGGLLVRDDVDGGVGEVLHDVAKQLCRHDRPALLLDERRSRVLDGELKVGRLEREGVAVRLDENA